MISDVLHEVVDFVSAASDLVVPGSGAVIDIVQALTYFLESSLDKNETSSSAAIVSVIICLGSVALYGPMQILASKMKSQINLLRDGLVKNANESVIKKARSVSSDVFKFLDWILKNSASLGTKILEIVKTTSESKLGKWVTSKFGSSDKFSAWILNFFKVKVPGLIKKFIDLISKLNPSSTSVDNLMIKKFGEKYTTEKVIEDKISELIKIKDSEIKNSGIPIDLQWSPKSSDILPDNVKYGQDSIRPEQHLPR